MLRLSYQGDWTTVLLDDFFPCDQQNSLKFSKSIRKQLWVILIEKAMAKLAGSYQALESIQLDLAVNALTGYPCKFFDFTNHVQEPDFKENLWFRLTNKTKKGYHFSAASNDTNNYLGIRRYHAYTILDVREYNKNRLILLRDPWGINDWKGDWSEHSAKWTPELKRAFGLPEGGRRKYSDKGLFWMSCDDFANFFFTIVVCNTKQTFIEQKFTANFLPGDIKQNLTAYTIKVYKNTEVNLSIFDKTYNEGHYSDIMFIIYSIKGKAINKLVSFSKCISPKFVCEELYLDTGEYLIIPILFSRLCTFDDTKYILNLDVKCNHKFELREKIDYDQLLLVDSLIDICVSRGYKYTDTYDKNSSYFVLKNRINGTLIVAENLNKNTYNAIEISFHQKKEIVSSRRDFRVFDFVPPNHRQILILVQNQNHFYSNKQFDFNAYFRQVYTDPISHGNTLYYPQLDEKNKILHSPRKISNNVRNIEKI